MSQESTQKADKSENSVAAEESINGKAPEVDVTIDGEDLEASESETVAEDKAADEAETAEDSPEEEPEETLELLETKYKKELADKDDKFMRLAAEFENYKKRTTQEMQSRIKFASQPLALNIITGLDNLERALVQAKEEENEQLKEFVRGVEMVQQQLFEALKQNNIERVYPKGEPFDPNKHEAMGVIETDEIEPDHIAEVFQAGYFLHDRVIRPAMVQVAKKK
ncbi:MAG: nucleotide exchange factor GrpE [Proteobacteria bacterium]|nr:nucleotide exchange factor GrpE [Pseudomonadota bacterium]